MRPVPGRRGAAADIDIQVASPLWQAQPPAEQIVRDAIAAATETISTQDMEMGILLTDDKAIRALNRQWRGVDEPTNVLSFPAAITTASAGAKFRGDLVFAYETIKRECDEEDRIFLHHLAHLAVHGFLHLLGYDHQVDAEAEEMEALETRIMARMNLPDPYLDRDVGNA
jgi:probable rRNA maturation factor